MIDRLSIDKKINDELINQIDERKYLGLDKSNSGRTELFLFAMGLGIKAGKRTPLQAKHGFILDSSVKSVDNAMSLFFSLLVDELRKTGEEDKIDDKEYAYKVAEEYANTGFKLLASMINSSKDEETIQYDLILEMDSLYDEILSKEELE